jgi:hypothetical protein
MGERSHDRYMLRIDCDWPNRRNNCAGSYSCISITQRLGRNQYNFTYASVYFLYFLLQLESVYF